MTIAKRKTLNWLLTGTAFVVAMAAAGCAQQAYHGPTTRMAIVPPETSKAVFELAGAEPVAPKINIFGEFNGQERTPVHSGGEAGFQQHTYVDEGYDGDVSVDPKGQWLVFASTRHSEHPNIYLQKVDGLSVTELTSGDADDSFPVFSPDGSKIAFCSTRGGNWDIYVMDSDGKNMVQITNSPMQELHPSFSPDGTRLAYCAMSSRSGQWELWTVSLITGEKRMIGFGLFPSWSSNKSKDQIAFQKSRSRGSRWFSLWTLDLVDGEARHVTEVAVSSNAAIVSPSWSPDGRKLGFATIVEPTRNQSGKPSGQQDIWTVNADGTNRHRITDGNGICASPFWASDNRIYFVSDRAGSEAIWSARADTTNMFNASADTKEAAHAAVETKELSH